MASAVKYEVFSENLAEGVHNLDTGTIKLVLTNSAPNASTHATLSDAYAWFASLQLHGRRTPRRAAVARPP